MAEADQDRVEDDVADALRDYLAGHAAIDTVTLKKRDISETTL